MKADWEIKPLPDIAEYFIGLTYKPEDVGNLGTIVLRSSNVQNNALDLSDLVRVNRSVRKPLYVRKGDILMCSRNGSKRLVGKTAVIGDLPEEMTFGTFMTVVRSDCSPYLSWFFRSEVFRDQLGVGENTMINQITKYMLDTIRVPVPPPAEQQRIVTLLDEAFDDIATAKANAEKNLQNARAIFESQLQAVFTHGGEGWTKTTIGKATGGVFTGPFGSLLHKSDYVENGIPLVNPAHITRIGIEPDLRKTVSESTSRKLSNYIMRKGDVVIGRRGEMGRCALVTEIEDGWLCGTGSFYIKPSPRCDSSYLVRFLRSDACKRRLKQIAGGAVMPNLSNSDLSNLSFDLPSIEIQKAIGDPIDVIAKRTLRLESIYQQKLVALDELKKSLLHQAFSGQL